MAMVLLYAEDHPGDQRLVQEALREAGVQIDLRLVNDGRELLSYLGRCGRRGDEGFPRPDLILLDLNMPGKSGIDALIEIKSNPFLWDIPIIVFTTSGEEADIARAYAVGATAYLRKPTRYSRLVRMMRALGKFWDIAQLPQSETGTREMNLPVTMSEDTDDDESQLYSWRRVDRRDRRRRA